MRSSAKFITISKLLQQSARSISFVGSVLVNQVITNLFKKLLTVGKQIAFLL